MKLREIFAIFAILFLAACGPAPASPPAPNSVPANATLGATTPVPTNEQPTPVGPTATPVITSAYLMAFHACDTANGVECNSPNNHLVYLAESNNGRDWSVIPQWQPYSGSVPDVVRRGNTLYVYSAGQNQLLRIFLDRGEAGAPESVKVSGLDFGFVDPSPTVDEQGRIVLFFLPGVQGADPAGCGDQATCTRQIMSAVEVEGSDGTEFELVEGARVSFEIDASADLKSFSDPDIYFDGQQYVLYISHGPSTSVWTSTQLHGTYTLIEGLAQGLLTFGTGGVPSGHYDTASQQYWTYAHVDLAGKTVIRLALHPNFSARLDDADFEIVLSGSSLGLGDGFIVASPGFTINQP